MIVLSVKKMLGVGVYYVRCIISIKFYGNLPIVIAWVALLYLFLSYECICIWYTKVPVLASLLTLVSFILFVKDVSATGYVNIAITSIPYHICW